MTFSKNGVALAVLGLEFILTSIGVEFEAGSVARVVEGSVVVGSFLLMVWNQITRKDSKFFIFKHAVPDA
jgi:hypothetical protein